MSRWPDLVDGHVLNPGVVVREPRPVDLAADTPVRGDLPQPPKVTPLERVAYVVRLLQTPLGPVFFKFLDLFLVMRGTDPAHDDAVPDLREDAGFFGYFTKRVHVASSLG